MRKMIVMLENDDTRYEIYMQGIERSNLDSTIVRWELRYEYIHKMSLGSSHSTGNRIYGEFEKFVSSLLLKGFNLVTDRKFA